MSSIKFRLRGSFLAVLAVSLVWIGCTDNRADLTSPADLGPNILVVDQLALSHALRVQKAHSDEMFEIAGVVGTGVGLTADGQLAVKIFTREAGVAGLPESLEGVPVAVEVTGMIFALRALADPTEKFAWPVPIGVSTGHPDITAGTIGARVRDVLGNVYALSNNHVYAVANSASIGDDVIQPGTFDGGALPDDFIGSLHAFEPIKFAKRRSAPKNTMDAAIVKSTTAMLGYATPDATPGGAYAPSSTIIPSVSPDQLVKKYGRTTGLTSGKVSAIGVEMNVCYEGFVVCTKWAKFVDQIVITPGTFSGGGDSGSLIVTDDGNNDPVGLLFAGSSTHTIANRIDLVLTNFGVTIDDGSSATAPTLLSIAVMPTSGTVEVGATQQFTATGTFSDDTQADITAAAIWSSTNEPVATVSAGLATGVAIGTTAISATQGEVLSNGVTLTVTAPNGTDDVVTINKAEYKSKAGRLQVAAESTDATAVLTAYDAADPNSLLGVLVDGKLNIRISPSPVVVLVKSDKGGSATETVQLK